MKLKEFLSKRGRQAFLARSIGLAPPYVWQIAHNLKPVPINKCAAIEIATQGEVTRKDLRPDDWHLIWPELAEKDHAA